jgi:hypothetical protein
MNMETPQRSRLDLEEDENFRRKFCKAQNIVWVLMLLFLTAGMLGLLGGSGPFASSVAGNTVNSLTVEYPRYLRNRAPIDIAIYVNAAHVTNGRVSIEIDRLFIERYDIQYINPEPSEVKAGEQSMTYVFELAGSERETRITFNVQPERFGYAVGRIRLEGEPEVRFWQIIYP